MQPIGLPQSPASQQRKVCKKELEEDQALRRCQLRARGLVVEEHSRRELQLTRHFQSLACTVEHCKRMSAKRRAAQEKVSGELQAWQRRSSS
mmetsp:Transcript_102394/g.298557  ORF Transcript_102394/g.298557 Transcript_102394/m.298557 type:complete len:92 (-) Transcript_102394:1528-1803(-)